MFNFQHFELDKENLQMLALRLSCAANSLYKELLMADDDCASVTTQTMSDVHNIITTIKPLVCWLDRWVIAWKFVSNFNWFCLLDHLFKEIKITLIPRHSYCSWVLKWRLVPTEIFFQINQTAPLGIFAKR